MDKETTMRAATGEPLEAQSWIDANARLAIQAAGDENAKANARRRGYIATDEADLGGEG